MQLGSDADVITFPSPRWQNDPVGIRSRRPRDRALVRAGRDPRGDPRQPKHDGPQRSQVRKVDGARRSGALVLLLVPASSRRDDRREGEPDRRGDLERGSPAIPRREDPDRRRRSYDLARSGLRDPKDDRQVWGITARDGEGLAGISGPNILVLTDEASGIPDRFFEVLGSSLAGSGGTARKCYISNPTRTTGEFYRSHTTNAQCSSASTSRARTRRTRAAPGDPGPRRAGMDRREEAGVRRGFAGISDPRQGRVRPRPRRQDHLARPRFPRRRIAWDDTALGGRSPDRNRPRRRRRLGDETAIAVRRGREDRHRPRMAFASPRTRSSSNIARLLVELPPSRTSRDPALGSRSTSRAGMAHLSRSSVATCDDAPHCRSSSRFARESRASGRLSTRLIRDSLWGTDTGMAQGRCDPDDVKLAQELNAPVVHRRHRPTDTSRRQPREVLRKELGRSPDRADAVCLAIWQFASVGRPKHRIEPPAAARDESVGARPVRRRRRRTSADRVFDPYGGGSAMSDVALIAPGRRRRRSPRAGRLALRAADAAAASSESMFEGEPEQARKRAPASVTDADALVPERHRGGDPCSPTQGDLSTYAARLSRSLRRDGVLGGVLSTRTGGLTRLPKQFRGTDRVVASLADDSRSAACSTGSSRRRNSR
jgi:hypothetical protein